MPFILIGVAIVAIVSFLAFNAQNGADVTPDRYVEIRRGNKLIITVPYTSKQTALEGSTDVSVTLTSPAAFSLLNYEFGNIINATGFGIMRLYNTTYTVNYEDFSGKNQLNGTDISGVSFDAKVGTDVTYLFSHKVMLFEGETLELKYRFDTNAAQIGTYDIRAVVNDNLILYRVKVSS